MRVFGFRKRQPEPAESTEQARMERDRRPRSTFHDQSVVLDMSPEEGAVQDETGRDHFPAPATPANERFEPEARAPLETMVLDIDARQDDAGAEDAMSELLREEKAELDAIRTNLHYALPFAVEPYLLLPETIWQSQYGWFLLSQLGLSPYRPWNALFLPVDDAGEEGTGLLVPPADGPKDFSLEQIFTSIGEVQRAFAGESDDAVDATITLLDTIAENHPHIVPEDADDLEEDVWLARRRIRALALATAPIDRDVIAASHEFFLAEPEIQLTA